MEYFIVVEGQTIEDQKALNLIGSVRIAKITSILTLKKPSVILPFKGSFPLVSENEYEFFLKQTKKQHLFEDLDSKTKQITMKAEKIMFFHNSFRKYLHDEEELGLRGFKLISADEQQEIFYKWLFKNKLDVGILHID